MRKNPVGPLLHTVQQHTTRIDLLAVCVCVCVCVRARAQDGGVNHRHT